jgi:threonine aldolase
MQQDHANARRLAEGLNEVPGIKVLSPSLGPRTKGLCWTNMVIFETEQGTVAGGEKIGILEARASAEAQNL